MDETRKEIQRLTMEQAFRADFELRSRISTLGSVVFGLSLLALQIDDPDKTSVVFFAWLFLGASVISSVLSAFLSNKASADIEQQGYRFWLDPEKWEIETSVTTRVETFVTYFSGVSLILGVVLLIVFAANNVA